MGFFPIHFLINELNNTLACSKHNIENSILHTSYKLREQGKGNHVYDTNSSSSELLLNRFGIYWQNSGGRRAAREERMGLEPCPKEDAFPFSSSMTMIFFFFSQRKYILSIEVYSRLSEILPLTQCPFSLPHHKPVFPLSHTHNPCTASHDGAMCVCDSDGKSIKQNTQLVLWQKEIAVMIKNAGKEANLSVRKKLPLAYKFCFL